MFAQAMHNYSERKNWTGNVRELLNTVEYSYYMGSELLCADDLPIRFMNKLTLTAKLVENKDNDIFFAFNAQDREIIKLLLRLLKCQRLGRRKMNELLIENNFDISEYKLRNLLKFMAENDLISYQHGRQGAEITEKGILLF